MRVGRDARGRAIATVLAIVLAAGSLACVTKPQIVRELVTPEQAPTLDKRSRYLKAHLRDGRVYVLDAWTVDEAAGTVTGTGELLGVDRTALERGEFTLRSADVAIFETNHVPRESLVATKAIVYGISIAATVGCIVAPKACFGSCPTFYASDGKEELLTAEGFSTSISPALETTDVDALYRVRPSGRRFAVRMANEALETHVVRHVDLLAARRPPGGRVIGTPDGEFLEVTGLAPPVSCQAAEGDCRRALAAFDGVERVSRTDGRDLATREVVELEFPGSGPEPLGLVIVARQTLLTTYLFYETLASMGSNAGAALAQLERGGPDIVDRAHAIRDILGGVEVLVPSADGGWQVAGAVHETGPLASDVRVVPLPRLDGPRKLRLRLTRGHWRLDMVALGRLGARVTPQRLPPVEVRRASGGIVPPGPVVAMPGDEHSFVYSIPEPIQEHELFLESRGYYLEWMREEWLAGEDPARALHILWNPRQALVDLAPGFSREEETMERAFWKSRYAGRP
jgi:hypothetical protein